MTERKKEYGRDKGKDGRKRGNCFNLNECGEASTDKDIKEIASEVEWVTV